MMTNAKERTRRVRAIGAAICVAGTLLMTGCGKGGDSEAPTGAGATTQRASLPPTKTGTPPMGRPVTTQPTAAVEAIYANDLPRLEALLDAGVHPNEQDENWESLLHHAARAGRYEAAQLLIERGADVNTRARLNATPLHWAARSNHLEVCRLLVENGADINARGGEGEPFTPMSLAARLNYVDIVDYLHSVGGEM